VLEFYLTVEKALATGASNCAMTAAATKSAQDNKRKNRPCDDTRRGQDLGT
jgi:hypothetical protein